MTVSAFLARIATQAEAALAHGPAPRIRRRWTMVQVSFGQPRIHYEVWVQGQRGQIEVGLHLEASPEVNAALLRCLGTEMLAVRAELGTDVELEQWTARWGRIHAYVPYARLDEAVADDVTQRLVAMIACLEPRLEACLGARE